MDKGLQAGGSFGVSRRRVLAATAWAIPVIAVASAAPAAAASVTYVDGRFGASIGANTTNPDYVTLEVGGRLRNPTTGAPRAPSVLNPTGPIWVVISLPQGYELDTSDLPDGWSVTTLESGSIQMENLLGLVENNDEFELYLTAVRVDVTAPDLSRNNRVVISMSTLNYHGAYSTVPN